MKVSILVVLIVLPMLATIGLYTYAFVSTRWSEIDEDLLEQYSQIKGRDRLQTNTRQQNSVQFDLQTIRHAFRSRYGLFGYCLEYKWLPLLTIKSSSSSSGGGSESYESSRTPNIPFCQRRCQPNLQCPETGCCMSRCNKYPDCPSYIDEKNCIRLINETRYYWPEENCMWQSTWIGNQALPRYLKSDGETTKDFHYFAKRLRYFVMFTLFIAAPLFTFLALLILICINCVERFYSIPFAFVGFFSFVSFLSGAGALGIFLYEWVQDRLHRPDHTYELDQTEALVVALNPWLTYVEKLGLAFWICLAAVVTSLYTSLLSCCFCCGLQSEKSKLRFNVKNETYKIIHLPDYETE